MAETAQAAGPVLHVFFDDYEWWVATDVEDARAQQQAMSGVEPAPASDWCQVDDATPMDLLVEDDQDGTVQTKPAGAWAQEHGRGFLGGTEV
jgi:hypothetical protein